MIYTTVADVLDELIKTEPSPKEMLETLKTELGLTRVVTVACLSVGGITISNIARITKVEDKHVHCIICELNKEAIDKIFDLIKDQNNDIDEESAAPTFISVCTIKFGDDLYTVLFTHSLYNGEYPLISKVYEVLTNEYMHTLSVAGLIDGLSEIDNYVERAYNLSCFYIPAMLTPTDKLPEHILNYKPLKQFVNYVSEHCKDIPWYTTLFDYNEITAIGGILGCEDILFDEEDMEDDYYDDEATDLS